ncbi:MAG TPA: hypothetical protein VNB91_13855 [Jatrophihabitantaceae bacterium]|jgi:hypothetical protein|nr:hypothetical protein [Jatrophihabitantaceae bacterium]
MSQADVPAVWPVSTCQDAFGTPADPDQQLVPWSAEKGASTHDKLRILTSWSAPATERDDART